MTEEEDDDEALPEDDKATFLLEELVMAASEPPSVLRLLLLDTTFLPEEDETFFPSLDPFDFADVPLRVTLLLLWMAEDEDSSSFTDVLLSPPQAVNEIKDERLKTRDKVAKNCFIGYPPQIKYTKFGQ